MAVSSARVVERGISVMRKTSRLTGGGSNSGGWGSTGAETGAWAWGWAWGWAVGWMVGTPGAALKVGDGGVGGEGACGAAAGAGEGEGVRREERLNGARNLLNEGILGVR